MAPATDPTAAPSRWVDLEGAFNVRDLGGLPAGGHVTARNVVYRGDSLDDVTPSDIEFLTGHVGLRTVVDLRGPEESRAERGWMSHAGIRYQRIPLFDLTGEATAGVRRAMATDVPAAYREMLALAAPAVAEVVSVVAGVRSAGGPALVHCAAGKDRTGIVVAVLLAAVGVDDEAIVADYLATGERLGTVRAALRRRAVYAESPGPLPAFSAEPIEAVLEVLRGQPGGANGFLSRAGAPAQHVSRLADVMLAPAGG
jgi:protein tyrosine/serine phosphatase